MAPAETHNLRRTQWSVLQKHEANTLAQIYYLVQLAQGLEITQVLQVIPSVQRH